VLVALRRVCYERLRGQSEDFTADEWHLRDPGEPIADPAVAGLESAIDRLEETLPPLKSFILPGGAPKGATLHLARTVCRRAERSVVQLGRAASVSPVIGRYLNRLSDLLFVLARAANRQAGAGDIPW